MLTAHKDDKDDMEEITEEDFLKSYIGLDRDNLLDIAHQPRDMIKYCKMHSRNGAKKCNALTEGKAMVFTARYGVCYMFNPALKDNHGSQLLSNYGGPSFGLELILDIEGKYFIIVAHKFTRILYPI